MTTIVSPPQRSRRVGGLLDVASVVESRESTEFYGGVSYETDCGLPGYIPDSCLNAFLTIEADGNGAVITVQNTEETAFSWEKDGTSISGATGISYTATGDGEYSVFDSDGYLIAQATIELPLLEDVRLPVKVFGSPSWVEGLPFTFYKGVECDLHDVSRQIEIAGQSLLDGQEYAIEEVFWTQLAKTAEDITPVAGTAVSFEEAFGLLEEAAGSYYAFQPTFHLGLRAYVKAVSESVVKNGETVAGSKVVRGAGYLSPVGPNGVAAGEGEAWVYVTGEVAVRLSEVFTMNAPALSRNRHFAIAERKAITTVECFAAAVLVSLA